jgi:hypothetical protein
VSRTSCSSARASRSAAYEVASSASKAPSPRPQPPCRRRGSAAAPPPSASPKSPGGLPLLLFLGVSPPPTAPLFIVADRQEAGSSAGNSGGKGSGGKGSGGKQRWEVSGGRNQRESGGVAAKGAPGVGLALPRCVGAPDRILPHKSRHGSNGSFIGLAQTPARFWGSRYGPFFGLKPKLRVDRILEGILGPPVEML